MPIASATSAGRSASLFILCSICCVIRRDIHPLEANDPDKRVARPWVFLPIDGLPELPEVVDRAVPLLTTNGRHYALSLHVGETHVQEALNANVCDFER